MATVLDYHRLDPYGLNKPIYDENDGHRHWADGEIIDRICADFPPDHLFGLFGTTPGQLGKVLRSAGLEVSWAASTNIGKGRQQIWEEVKRSVRSKLARHSLYGHEQAWRSSLECPLGRDLPSREIPYVHLANTKNIAMVPKARFLRAFECWFMLPRFHHCAVFAHPKTVGSLEQPRLSPLPERPLGPSVEDSCRGWLRVSIALVLESRLYADTSPNWSNIPRHRSSSGYCPWSSPCESAALAAGCFETHVLVRQRGLFKRPAPCLD